MKKCCRIDCIHIGELQPLDNFYPDKRSKDGKQSHCRDCHRAFAEAYKYKEKTKPKNKICTKQDCSRLGELQPIDNFYVMLNSPDGHISYCKECSKKKESSRYYEKRDEILEKSRYDWETNKNGRKDKTIPSNPNRKDTPQRKAQSAVANAIQGKDFPPAKTLKCERCKEQAQAYHHYSYKKEDWLNVIPLCHKCHGVVRRKPNPKLLSL